MNHDDRPITAATGGTPEHERLMDEAAQHSLFGARFVALMVAKTPGQRIWQLCLSLYGTDFTVLSAYPTPSEAALALRDARAFITALVPYDGAAAAAYFDRLTATSPIPPTEVADSVVRQLASQIEKHLVTLN